MKRYCFDIDGTICSNTWGKYGDALPFSDRIDTVNKLYDKGNHITYFTASGIGICEVYLLKTYYMWYNFTLDQLKSWKCKFHELRLGKPNADYFIDDKGISDGIFFG